MCMQSSTQTVTIDHSIGLTDLRNKHGSTGHCISSFTRVDVRCSFQSLALSGKAYSALKTSTNSLPSLCTNCRAVGSPCGILGSSSLASYRASSMHSNMRLGYRTLLLQHRDRMLFLDTSQRLLMELLDWVSHKDRTHGDQFDDPTNPSGFPQQKGSFSIICWLEQHIRTGYF